MDEALRQHRLFGGQTIERDGGMYRVGHHEADWSAAVGGSSPSWQRVALFWATLSELEPPTLLTSAGLASRQEALAQLPATEGAPTPAQVATREALLRAAIVDTPWSAVFISHLMKSTGFSREEFVLSDSHSDYVQAAIDASAVEAAGQATTQAFRACDAATTPPRAGDLLCATRAGTAGTASFETLPAAMGARRAAGQAFPMHCDIVVHAGEGADAGLDTIGGNVLNSVTMSRMTLDGRRVLSESYLRASGSGDACEPGTDCRGHLSRRPWVVLLQFRD